MNEEELKSKPLDFFDLIEIVLSKKIIIIFLAIIFFSGSYYYSNNNKGSESFVENYKIQSLGPTESVPIKILNDFIANLLNNNLIRQTLELGEIDLAKYYDKEIKIDPITSNFLVDSLYNKIISQQLIEIMTKKHSFDFPYPGIRHNLSKSDIGDLKTINISFHHHGTEKDYLDKNKGIFSNTYLEEAKKLLTNDLYENITYAINASEFAKDNIIIQLKEQNKQLIEQYKLNLIEKIYDLREQASIARELGIESHYDVGGKEIQATKDTIVELQQQVYSSSEGEDGRLDYLRGYKALEKEIEILETRKDINPYVPQIRANIVAIDTLSNKDFINKDKIIESIGLNTDSASFRFVKQQKSVNYNAPVFYFRGFNQKNFITYSTIFGILLGVIYSIINFAYRRHKKMKDL